MNLKRLIEKIEKEDFQFIQEKVLVQYDSSQKLPLGFKWRNKHYEVLQLLHKFVSMEENPQYIVLTDKGIYCLSYEFITGKNSLNKGRWLLKFKVDGEYHDNQNAVSLYTNLTSLQKNPSENASSSNYSFLPVELANLAHYHGHVCPELAVG